MTILPLTFAPDPIFSEKVALEKEVTPELTALASDLHDTIIDEKAVGISANMVGISKNIIVIDMQDENQPPHIAMINPRITKSSEETQSFTEASICFRGISAKVTRPSKITVSYLDLEGSEKTLEADGYFATVIQHEIDYLNGIIFLDYVSSVRRGLLIKKMKKHNKKA